MDKLQQLITQLFIMVDETNNNAATIFEQINEVVEGVTCPEEMAAMSVLMEAIREPMYAMVEVGFALHEVANAKIEKL